MYRIRPLHVTLLLLSVLTLTTGGVAGAAGVKTGVTKSSLPRTANNATLGTILVAPNGKTLYHFSLDRHGTIGCTGRCLQFWFPLRVAKGAKVPSRMTGITGKLGEINRGHGVMQVTYRGHPLYTFIGDQKAGQTSGQGFKDFDGVWSVATVKAASSGGNTGSSTGGTTGGSYGGGYGMP